jgi:hypothetical protein
MTIMLKTLVKLGQELSAPENHSILGPAISKAEAENRWFTREFILKNLNYWHRHLTKEKLETWLSAYSLPANHPQTVGIVMAGNIPLVGMHDLICVLLAGHKAFVKVSSKDKVLPNAIRDVLIHINPSLQEKITISDERFSNVDAVMATGSNNTARYFDYYFRSTPHIIRKNRNGIAVLTGQETDQDLQHLAHDVFDYFGMGCRNVSKLYLPASMDETRILDHMEAYSYFRNHNKYMNNYVYHKAIMLMDQQHFLDNDFLLLREHTDIASPVAVLHFERYDTVAGLKEHLKNEKNNIQCVASGNVDWPGQVNFGQTQNPDLHTYADGIDSMRFLLNL